MTDTTQAQDHAAAVRDNADIGHDRSAIEHRANHIAEFVGGASLAGVMAGEIIVLLNNIGKKHDALAAERDAANARLAETKREKLHWESVAAKALARADNTRLYADWLESWAAGTQALSARHMAQERARLGVDAGRDAAISGKIEPTTERNDPRAASTAEGLAPKE